MKARSPEDWVKLDEAIRSRYPQEGGSGIAIDLGVPSGSVRARASELGVKSLHASRRQADSKSKNSKTVNTTYFEGPWTSQMAYLVGYIYADGCNNEKGKSQGKQNRSLDFHCEISDKELLEAIKEEFGSNHSFTYSEGRLNPTNGSWTKESVHLQVSSTYLTQTLELRFGVCPRKSRLDLSFPNLPEGHLNHFSRGYFDGDGCGSRAISFHGSYRFIEGLRDRIIQSVGVRWYKLYPTTSVWTAVWQQKDDVRKLYQWLYPDEGPYIFLRRKKESVERFLNQS